MCLLNKYYRNCGGHHDSDRIAVLVMVSKAESIVLYHLVSVIDLERALVPLSW